MKTKNKKEVRWRQKRKMTKPRFGNKEISHRVEYKKIYKRTENKDYCNYLGKINIKSNDYSLILKDQKKTDICTEN